MVLEGGDKKEINRLLKAGININVKDWVDMTCLFDASRYGSYEIVKLLIKKKANVNLMDLFSLTALSIASSKGYKKISS